MAPKVGLYLRLSREDDERELESQSVSNQREFLLQYAARQNWAVLDIYIDDGWTGTNFERPDFRRLLQDIEKKKIDTVITKDLSRLGRDYIGVGHYLERYFPQNGIRYIAVNENIDTANQTNLNQLTPFLSVINDFYAADISRKVRTALDTRKHAGFFIGSTPPLGYLKHPTEKGKLVVDPDTAPVVSEVFREYLASGSLIGTARSLTQRGISTPSECKGRVPAQTRFPGMWSDQMVRRILMNPTYAGHLTQNRARKVSYKVERRVSLPSSEWVTISNTHEPLISQVEFDRVQEMISVRSYPMRRGAGGHLLTGIVFCADCGSPMTYVKESEQRTYMVCQGYRRAGRLRRCTSHCVREEFVLEAIQSQLQSLVQQLDQQTILNGVTFNQHQNQRKRQIETTRKRMEDCKTVLHNLYLDKVTGVISDREFSELMDSARKERDRLELYLNECISTIEQDSQKESWKERIREILSFEYLERSTLITLIDRVLIHEDKRIELFFRFRTPG
jgi:site-specific DNA recombinase